MTKNIKTAPSILAADFSCLGEEIKRIRRGGAHYLHFDVMDGHFVSDISFGLPVLKSIRPLTDLAFDVHLMTEQPERFIEAFAKAGADIITVHCETVNAVSCLKQIRALGKKPAIALNPGTPVNDVLCFADAGMIDMILLMSVAPGKGGQVFRPEVLYKAEESANYAAKNNLNLDVEMDGGITLSNISSVLDAGVNILVAGSAIFEKDRTEANMAAFTEACLKHVD